MDRTDLSWVEQLAAAGPVQHEALEALREILFSRLRRTFLGRSGADESLLEDATQEAVLKVLGSLDQFQGKSRFTTWATAIAVRAALTELRKRRWKDISLDQLLQDTPGGRHAAGVDADPQAEAQQGALVGELYRLIDNALTAKQRTALLAELKGMPLEEIARHLGSNRNAVYKLTHDARKRLKGHLEAAGYTAADLQTA